MSNSCNMRTSRSQMTRRGLTGAVLYAKDMRRVVEFYSAVADIQVQTIQERFAVLGR